MRSMGHPNYEYTPHSAARRERASNLAKRRIGAPPGHSTVYGVHVPDEHARAVRKAAEWVSINEGRTQATAYVASLRGKGWHIEEGLKPWSVQEEAALRKRYFANHSAKEIADALGRTKNSVIGKAHRLGIVRKWGRTVPISQVREMVSAHFEGEEDWLQEGLICVCPMFINADPHSIAAYTGVAVEITRKHYRTMNRLGIWQKGNLRDIERYTRRDKKSGLQESDLALILDAGVLKGVFVTDGEGYALRDARRSRNHFPTRRAFATKSA